MAFSNVFSLPYHLVGLSFAQSSYGVHVQVRNVFKIVEESWKRQAIL